MSRKRKLIGGQEVPESRESVPITITSKCPQKWAFVDMETGDIWVHYSRTPQARQYSGLFNAVDPEAIKSLKAILKSSRHNPQKVMGGNYHIGWFGVPGRDGEKTHIVLNKKPVCNTRLPKDSEFQWCSSYMNSMDVECEKCKEWRKTYAHAFWSGVLNSIGAAKV